MTTITVRVSAISRTPKPTLPRFSVFWMLAGARAGDGAVAQLAAALALERRLLLELDLELVDALTHAEVGR